MLDGRIDDVAIGVARRDIVIDECVRKAGYLGVVVIGDELRPVSVGA